MAEPTITVNGVPRSLHGVPTWVSALDWLRELGLTGAKEGCAEGECGACSVMVVRPDDQQARWTAINACLAPALALDGQEVITSEGLGTPDRLHPVQQELAARGGSQCGYCTPGFVCSTAAEYYRPGRSADRAGGRSGDLNDFDLHAIAGNLCRCTGYRPIRDAVRALGIPPAEDPLAERTTRPAPPAAPTRVADFTRPADLGEAFAVLNEHPDATVLAGGTDVGVEVNLRGARPAHVVAVDRLPELRGFHVSGDGIVIGAALTLSEVEAALAGRIPMLDDVVELFASRLIRNSATIGGNLGTASPIGDLAPALMALEASVLLVSADSAREVPIADYFTGYRQTVRRDHELIRAVRVPLPTAGIAAFHKISKRRLDDISSVAVGFAIQVADGTVTSARIGLGGVAATPIRALASEAALEGRRWEERTIRDAAEVMRGEGTPLDDHRASAAYRSAMLGTALVKLWEETR